MASEFAGGVWNELYSFTIRLYIRWNVAARMIGPETSI
jgi:hypothetical protein